MADPRLYTATDGSEISVDKGWFFPESAREQARALFGQARHLRSLSFTYQSDGSAWDGDIAEPLQLLVAVISASPNLSLLHVATRCDFRLYTLPTVRLPNLRELRVEGFIPFIGAMPMLQTVIWKDPREDELDKLPKTLHRLSIAGDLCKPEFQSRFPHLRELLFDCSDVWTNSSYWSLVYRRAGVRNKLHMIDHVLEHLPPRLQRLTLVESLAVRLIERTDLVTRLRNWAQGDTGNLPQTLRLLHQSAEPPEDAFDDLPLEPLYQDPGFTDVRAAFGAKNVLVETVSMLARICQPRSLMQRIRVK